MNGVVMILKSIVIIQTMMTNWIMCLALGLSLDSAELSKDQKSLSRDSGLTLSEDDRESPGLSYHTATFHRSDWARQAARMRSLDNTAAWIEEDEAFCASNER